MDLVSAAIGGVLQEMGLKVQLMISGYVGFNNKNAQTM